MELLPGASRSSPLLRVLIFVLVAVLSVIANTETTTTDNAAVTGTTVSTPASSHPVFTFPPLSPDMVVTKRKDGEKPVVYIHVGPHKTGSTHIQTLLMQQQSWLSNLGYCTASFNVTQRKTAKHMQFLVKELSLYGKSLITPETIDYVKVINNAGKESSTNGNGKEKASSAIAAAAAAASTAGHGHSSHNSTGHGHSHTHSHGHNNHVTIDQSPVSENHKKKTTASNKEKHNGTRRNLRSKKDRLGDKKTGSSYSDGSNVAGGTYSAAATPASAGKVDASSSHPPSSAVSPSHSKSTNQTGSSAVPIPADPSLVKGLSLKEKYQRLWPFTIHELDHCIIKSNQHMIISAENYMTLPLIQLVNFHYLLTEVYQVEVVYIAVYREYLNQVYSMYTQLTKLFHHSIRSFADHLFRSSDSLLDDNTVFNMNRIANVLSAVPQTMTMVKSASSAGSGSGNDVLGTSKTEEITKSLQDVISKSKPAITASTIPLAGSTSTVTTSAVAASATPGSRLQIIDYYGTMAANLDIGYTFFCEILHLGCQEHWLIDLNTHSTRENVAPTILYHQLYKVLRNFALARNYRICMGSTSGSVHGGNSVILYDNHNRQYLPNERVNLKTVSQINDVIELIIQSFIAERRKFPSVTSNMEMFHSISIAIDQQLRANYDSVILHSNITAHRETLNNFQVTSLDEIPFYHDSRWMNWLQDELDRQVQAGRMCPMHVPTKATTKVSPTAAAGTGTAASSSKKVVVEKGNGAKSEGPAVGAKTKPIRGGGSETVKGNQNANIGKKKSKAPDSSDSFIDIKTDAAEKNGHNNKNKASGLNNNVDKENSADKTKKPKDQRFLMRK